MHEMRARARTIWGAALVLAIAADPRTAGAINICSGAFQITYPVGVNFPQPVPPGNPGDDTLTVKLDIGAGAILTSGGAGRLTVADIRFDLDCADPFPVPGCTDAGDIMEYLGDGTIVSDCSVSGASVTWTSTALTANQLRFTPTPSIPIDAGTPVYC